MRKIVIFIILALLVVLALIWGLYHFRNDTTTATTNSEKNSAFKVIPVRTPLVLEIPDIMEFISRANQNVMFSNCMEIEGLKSFKADLDNFSSLFEQEQIRKMFMNKKILIAFNLEGKNDIGSMFAFSLKSKSEKNEILDYIKELGSSFTKHEYNENLIYTYKSDKSTFYFSENNGILFASRHILFVEEAIRQVSGESLYDESLFQQLYTTINNSSSANVFVNHNGIDQFLRKAVSPALKGQVDIFNRFASRTELDVTLKEKEIFSGGFSFEGNGDEWYVTSFKSQTPAKFDMDKVISANAAMFLSITLSDFKKFQDDYVEFLKKYPKDFYSRETSLKKMETYFEKKAFIPQFVDITGNDFAMVYGTVMPNDFLANRFFIGKASNISQAKLFFTSAIERYAKSSNTPMSEMTSQFQLGNEKLTIYSFPFADFPQLILGNAFSAVQSNYLCFWGEYFIFSDHISSLKSYLQDLTASRTLAKNQQFSKFNSQMSSRSTFYYYMNIPRSVILMNYYLNNNITTSLLKDEPLKNFFGFGWQLSASSGKYLNNMYLKYDSIKVEEPLTTWQFNTDSGIASKPYIVVNHNDKKNNEVLFQDKNNNLSLVDKEGKVLWKVPISGEIKGEIHQIDYYKNGKLQYLFNTSAQIYLIDRNGKNVFKFPAKLKSPATNGISVFDYDNNKEYRFFIASEDKLIYVYDRNGQIVKGWKFNGTSGVVTNPVMHVREQGRDYIVCADDKQLYILDRQGSARVNIDDKYVRSMNDFYLAYGEKPYLVASDNEGVLHLQYLDGKTGTLKLGKFGENHFFIAEDVNNDKNTDFIIAYDKKIYVYNHSGKKIFERGLDSQVTEKPVVFKQENGRKMIGVVCGNSNRTYLIDAAKGDLYKGFPLQGNHGLTVGYLTHSSSFNVIVGMDSKLLNYKVE